MKKLIKLLLILGVVQIFVAVVGRLLKERLLSQEIEEGEINAVVVQGGAEEKVTIKNFKGGYLRALMGGVELDLTEATIENPPATIEAMVVMGGAEITVPEDWKVRVDARSILGGIHDANAYDVLDDEATPDLVLTGNVVLGGVAINHKAKEVVADTA